MSYTFELTTRPTTSMLKALKKLLKNTGKINSEKEYNQLLVQIITLTKTYPLPKNQGHLFRKELQEATRSYPLSEPTPWGGVPIKAVDVEKDYIRKLLVIKQYGILGFEIHKYKLEKLNILEGICLLIASQRSAKDWQKGQVSVALGKKGNKVVLEPGDEHGIIALTNCVIEEQSTNHLTDLSYIFESDQVE